MPCALAMSPLSLWPMMRLLKMFSFTLNPFCFITCNILLAPSIFPSWQYLQKDNSCTYALKVFKIDLPLPDTNPAVSGPDVIHGAVKKYNKNKKAMR
jgi:hypothetical protein